MLPSAPPDKMQPRAAASAVMDAKCGVSVLSASPPFSQNPIDRPECVRNALLDSNALRRHSGPKDRSEVWLTVTPEMRMDDAVVRRSREQ
jgi:hypothetical protein